MMMVNERVATSSGAIAARGPEHAQRCLPKPLTEEIRWDFDARSTSTTTTTMSAMLRSTARLVSFVNTARGRPLILSTGAPQPAVCCITMLLHVAGVAQRSDYVTHETDRW